MAGPSALCLIVFALPVHCGTSTRRPSFAPSLRPTQFPTTQPSVLPTFSPSFLPTSSPILAPSLFPISVAPTSSPHSPTIQASINIGGNKNNNNATELDETTITIISVCVVVGVIAFALFFWCYNKKRLKRRNSQRQLASFSRPAPNPHLNPYPARKKTLGLPSVPTIESYWSADKTQTRLALNNMLSDISTQNDLPPVSGVELQQQLSPSSVLALPGDLVRRDTAAMVDLMIADLAASSYQLDSSISDEAAAL